jgi:hypothetical protein
LAFRNAGLDAHLSTVASLLDGGRSSGPVGHRLHVLDACLAQNAGQRTGDH